MFLMDVIYNSCRVSELYKQNINLANQKREIVGIVGDVRRDMEGHHYAEKCSVFGISDKEFKVFEDNGLKMSPSKYKPDVDRFQVKASPWRVMRLLAAEFGYYIPAMPLQGRVESDAGERRTCIFTLQRNVADETN